MEIRIVVHSGDNTPPVVRTFQKTIKGAKESEKYIKALHEERLVHAWYWRLDKIRSLKSIIRFYRSGSRSKALTKLNGQIERLEAERQDLLDMLGITEEPAKIKLEITTE